MFMKSTTRVFSLASALLLLAGIANAHDGKYSETVNRFRNAGESASFFHKSYAYAVFPTVGEAGFVVGGALGKGHVYVNGHLVGDTTMGQASVGFQAGGKAYSQVIFFEDRQALEKFESGTFQFEAGASAIAITASASASVGTSGTSAGASADQNVARATGAYQNGMAVFTIAKGGLMYAATIAGQKFSYTPRGA
jgi:lipid-binding SYLF domain-containing protein